MQNVMKPLIFASKFLILIEFPEICWKGLVPVSIQYGRASARVYPYSVNCMCQQHYDLFKIEMVIIFKL